MSNCQQRQSSSARTPTRRRAGLPPRPAARTTSSEATARACDGALATSSESCGIWTAYQFRSFSHTLAGLRLTQPGTMDPGAENANEFLLLVHIERHAQGPREHDPGAPHTGLALFLRL